jgi:hypothetical protein
VAGSATIIGQAVDRSLTSFPRWTMPTRIRIVADMTGGAPVARAADTTPGLTITNGAGAGVFDITFPAGLRMGDFNPQVLCAGGSVAATRFFPIVDVSTTNTNATTGKLRVTTASTGAAANPANGDVIDVAWSIDYG